MDEFLLLFFCDAVAPFAEERDVLLGTDLLFFAEDTEGMALAGALALVLVLACALVFILVMAKS